MPMSNSSARTYTASCQMIHRGNVSLEQLVINIIYLEMLWVEIHRRVGMWCLICFLKTKKSSNTFIAISLLLFIQIKSKSNMSMFLIQKDKLLMTWYMIHRVKQNKMREEIKLIQKMVMEVRRKIISRNQLHQLKFSSTWKKQDISNAKYFECEFPNSGRIKKIKWGIIGDTEYITEDNLVDIPDYYGPELLK